MPFYNLNIAISAFVVLKLGCLEGKAVLFSVTSPSRLSCIYHSAAFSEEWYEFMPDTFSIRKEAFRDGNLHTVLHFSCEDFMSSVASLPRLYFSSSLHISMY